jgi:glucose-6-phosphate 1-dehydrogenase
MPVELSAVEKDKTGQESPYERLLTDAMHGDKLLFVREDVVEAAWSIVDPILNDVVPLRTYNPGAWGPEEADRLAADVGGWRDPKPPAGLYVIKRYGKPGSKEDRVTISDQ